MSQLSYNFLDLIDIAEGCAQVYITFQEAWCDTGQMRLL